MSAATSLTARSLASVAACAASGLVLGIDDNVVLLDVDRERLRDVGTGLASGQVRAGLDVDLVALDPRLARAQERLARGEVVLPAVPRAGQQRRLRVELEVAGPARARPRRDPSLAQRPTLVRAAVADPVEPVAHAEHADRPTADRDDPAVTGLEVVDGRDDDLHRALAPGQWSHGAHMSDRRTR